MRFLHTSDWHLGRYFYGRHLTEDQAILLDDLLRIVDEEKVEGIIIAGDIYDRSIPPVEAVELFDEILTKLLFEKKLRVACIAGNHDSGSRLGFGSEIFSRSGLDIRGELVSELKPVVWEDAFGKIYLQLYPYADPGDLRSVFGGALLDFDAATGLMIEMGKKLIPEGVRSVAISHCYLMEGDGSESERPLSIGGSSFVSAEHFDGFHYTALGHLHRPQKAGGKEHIRYSGSLMKYSFDEVLQKKGIYVVDMDGKGEVQTKSIPLVPKRDLIAVQGYFDELLNDRAKFPKTEDYVSVKLLDEGPILDASRKLLSVYPNLMHLERAYYHVNGTLDSLDAQGKKKLTEQEWFEDFFQAMTGRSLSDAEQDVLVRSMEEIARKERER